MRLTRAERIVRRQQQKLEAMQRWTAKNKDTPRYKYWSHIKGAKRRGIPFLLTFEEWWQIWEASGHWAEMGRRRGQYCMSRPGDQGAYEVGNVVICLNEKNTAERNRRCPNASTKGRKRFNWPDGTWTLVYPEGTETC